MASNNSLADMEATPNLVKVLAKLYRREGSISRLVRDLRLENIITYHARAIDTWSELFEGIVDMGKLSTCLTMWKMIILIMSYGRKRECDTRKANAKSSLLPKSVRRSASTPGVHSWEL